MKHLISYNGTDYIFDIDPSQWGRVQQAIRKAHLKRFGSLDSLAFTQANLDAPAITLLGRGVFVSKATPTNTTLSDFLASL